MEIWRSPWPKLGNVLEGAAKGAAPAVCFINATTGLGPRATPRVRAGTVRSTALTMVPPWYAAAQHLRRGESTSDIAQLHRDPQPTPQRVRRLGDITNRYAEWSICPVRRATRGGPEVRAGAGLILGSAGAGRCRAPLSESEHVQLVCSTSAALNSDVRARLTAAA
jgi:hypothetical protein